MTDEHRGHERTSTEPSPEPPISLWKRLLGIALSAILLIAITVYSIVTKRADEREREKNQPAFAPVTEQITESTFTITPGKYVFFKFVVPQKSQKVTVEGNFQVNADKGDTEIFLLTADAFTVWQDNRQFRSLYDSGRVKSGTLDVTLPPRDETAPAVYYIVFSNASSYLSEYSSDTVVNADIRVHYHQGR